MIWSSEDRLGGEGMKGQFLNGEDAMVGMCSRCLGNGEESGWTRAEDLAGRFWNN